MNKNEIKLNIAQSFEAGNRALFTKSALEYAALIDSVKELNEFTEFIFNKQVHSGIDDIEKKELLKEIIKDKIFELIIAKGDTPSRNYLLLYDLYKEGEGLEDARLDKYINFIDENVKSQKYGDMERIYFAHLRFLLSFMRGDKDSFKQFLKNILTLNIHQLESASEVAFIREFIAKMEIGLEEFFETFREILAPEYYFSLSYGERRSMFNWAFHCLWNVPKLFNDRRWMELYPLWKAIFYGHLERGEMDEALYVHFYIYHKMGNSFHTQTEWRMFNEEISRYASRYYIEWAKNHNLIEAKKEERKEGKKLIGILKDRIVENAPFKVEYSVLEPMMKDESFTSKYDVKIYNMNYIEKSDSSPEMMALFQKIGIEIIDAHQPFYTQGYYFSHLQKALYLRQKMIDDGVDIMIVACNGYDISDFIVATRAAPKQIFWCHGNFEYDIEGIDKRITHIDKNTPQKQSDYLVEHFDFESDERYLGLDEERFRAEADKVRARFPEGTVILGAIGRLVKVDSKEYLEAVAKIMKECPNTVYLACGTGNVDSVQKQVEELGIGDRFYFEGWIDPDIYGYVIDVYLDTFPERGGMSVVEYGKKNNGIVISKKDSLNSNLNYSYVAYSTIKHLNKKLTEPRPHTNNTNTNPTIGIDYSDFKKFKTDILPKIICEIMTDYKDILFLLFDSTPDDVEKFCIENNLENFMDRITHNIESDPLIISGLVDEFMDPFGGNDSIVNHYLGNDKLIYDMDSRNDIQCLPEYLKFGSEGKSDKIEYVNAVFSTYSSYYQRRRDDKKGYTIGVLAKNASDLSSFWNEVAVLDMNNIRCLAFLTDNTKNNNLAPNNFTITEAKEFFTSVDILFSTDECRELTAVNSIFYKNLRILNISVMSDVNIDNPHYKYAVHNNINIYVDDLLRDINESNFLFLKAYRLVYTSLIFELFKDSLTDIENIDGLKNMLINTIELSSYENHRDSFLRYYTLFIPIMKKYLLFFREDFSINKDIYTQAVRNFMARPENIELNKQLTFFATNEGRELIKSYIKNISFASVL